MPFARLLVLTTAFGVLPLVAAAQTAPASQTAPAPKTAASSASAMAQPAPPPVPLTQNVTVVDPNMQALTPGTPSIGHKPHWGEFPHMPKNVPTLAEFAGRVHKEEADNAVVATIGRSIVWEKFQPDAIAADANSRIDPSKMVPIDPQLTPEQTEAYAQSLRAQVTPPPLAQ